MNKQKTDMLSKEIIIKRLVAIKHLYSMGVQMSHQTDSIASFSVLALHDCVEMFLFLAAENQGERPDRNTKFLQYWDMCKGLTQKGQMSLLNDRRVMIKHKCVAISKDEIEKSRVSVTTFFEENTPIQFGMQFDEIRLSSLINDEVVRKLIETAEENINGNEFFDCLRNCKIAYKTLLDNYEANKRNMRLFHNPLEIGEKIGNDYRRLIDSSSHSEERWFEQVTESVNALRETLKMTALGIDFKRYSYFSAITPRVFAACKRDVYGIDYFSEDKELFEKKHILRKEDCLFCIEFVIDCALKLQKFDYSLENVMRK